MARLTLAVTGRRHARRPRDLYRTTDAAAVRGLRPFLLPGSTFCEPCAGLFDLAILLERVAGLRCVAAYDVAPPEPGIGARDARTLTVGDLNGAREIITNPPWSRPLLHELIGHLSSLAPTWLLFDADWKETQQAGPLLASCSDIVPIGRVIWQEGTGNGGMHNCCWYRFDSRTRRRAPRFHARAAE